MKHINQLLLEMFNEDYEPPKEPTFEERKAAARIGLEKARRILGMEPLPESEELA